jgi:hypothetical protein
VPAGFLNVSCDFARTLATTSFPNEENAHTHAR